MKRSWEENTPETKRKSKTKFQTTIILDQTIQSDLLLHKLKYQTTELQLFLQHVPVLYFCPLDIAGTQVNPGICGSLFSAAMRIPFHKRTLRDMLNIMLATLVKGRTIGVSHLLESIFKLYEEEIEVCHANSSDSQDFQILEKKVQLKRLLLGLLDDELFVLSVLKETAYRHHNPITYLSDRMKDNERVVLEAVQISVYALSYASRRLRDCEQIVLEAVKKDGRALEFASKRLKDNEQIVLLAVKQNGIALRKASNRLKDNDIIVLEAVKQRGTALSYASDRLKDTKLIVLEAIKQDGNALVYVSDRLKDNEQFVSEIVKNDSRALSFSFNRSIFHEKVILEAIQRDGLALSYLSDMLRDDEKIVLLAVKQNGQAVCYASKRLKNNELIVLEAVKQNGLALEYASARLKDTERIVLEAVKQNGYAFSYASERLKNDSSFTGEILSSCSNCDAFPWFGEKFRNTKFICGLIENNLSNFRKH